jgi:hypothetical protein
MTEAGTNWALGTTRSIAGPNKRFDRPENANRPHKCTWQSEIPATLQEKVPWVGIGVICTELILFVVLLHRTASVPSRGATVVPGLREEPQFAC